MKPDLSSEPNGLAYTPSVTPREPMRDLGAEQIFRPRRSAVSFDGVTSMSADAFFAMLDSTLPRSVAPPWCTWPLAAAVHPSIMAHRVDGLELGLYMQVRDPGALGLLNGSLRTEWM